MDFIAHLNGLIIITSAIFAIAQYLDKNHKEEMFSLIANLKIKFAKPNKKNSTKKLKLAWENYVFTDQWVELKYQIIISFILLCVYLGAHVVLLSSKIYAYSIPSIGSWFLLFSIIMLINAIWITINLYRMGNEKKSRREQHKNITEQIKLIKKFKKQM